VQKVWPSFPPPHHRIPTYRFITKVNSNVIHLTDMHEYQPQQLTTKTRIGSIVLRVYFTGSPSKPSGAIGTYPFLVTEYTAKATMRPLSERRRVPCGKGFCLLINVAKCTVK
jgi:hypothetical protein